MKKVYVSHSTNFDFKKELYEPLKKLKDVELIFPHEYPEQFTISISKNIIAASFAVIAEVSYPSHGVGIELGWANSFGIPIIFIFKKGTKPSSSLKILSDEFIEYENLEDIIPKLSRILHTI